jgi:D-glycero-alpha-D-manno-heptose 1-phosphate guanylyltransferase
MSSSNFNDVIAVILAGGYGTRIKHLLNGLPKPMAPVANKPFVEWVVRYLQIQGITKAVLSTGYLAEVVEEYFRLHPVEFIQTNCCQETSPLGTAGGFLNVVHQTEESPSAWLVVNGDSLVLTDLAPLTTYLADGSVDGVIVGLSVTDASRYGSLVCDEHGRLVKFAEKRPGSGVVSAGVYLLRHSLLKEFPKNLPLSFESEVFPTLLSQNICLKVYAVKTPFLDIGTPESLMQAESFILQNNKFLEKACP